MPFLCNASLPKLRKHPMFTVTFIENLGVSWNAVVLYLLIIDI